MSSILTHLAYILFLPVPPLKINCPVMKILVCLLLFCFVQIVVDAQVTISADKFLSRDGETVILTCSIPSLPASWKNASSDIILAFCPPSGPCQLEGDTIDTRYSFSATASSIGVTITSFNSIQDTFVWKCQYGTNSAVYVIKHVVPVTTVELTNTSSQTLSSTLNIVRGGITYIRCSTAPRGSRPPATFRWYSRTVNQSSVLIGNQSISSTPGSVMVPGQPASDLVISYSTLTQTGATLYQNMFIFCEARDEMSTGNYIQSGEVQLNIVYPPLVQLSPNYSVYNVTEGTQNFVFTCNIVEANPLPQLNGYSWFHKSVVIQGQVSSSYTIPSVQKSDDGEYKCTAKNDYGNGTSDFLALNVQYPPLILGLTSPYKVIEYLPLNVTCQVNSNPPPDQISWSPSGESSVPSTLYFSSVSRNNSRIYSCTAQNTMKPTVGGQQIGINTIKIEVDVLYPPSIQGVISPYKVIEYQHLNVNCRVSSNPPPDQIYWSPSGEGSVSSMLYFSSVSRNKSGMYSCKAQNTLIPTVGRNQTGRNTSQIQIDVLYTATITEFVVKNNVSEIRENGALELYCHVDSNPYSAISLYFADVLISRTQDSPELIFNTTAGCLNAGKYICSATNSIMNGVTVSAEVNLKVQCGPRLDYRKNISTMYYRSLKDNVAFEVHLIAYPEPIDIMWYHRGNKTDKWQQVPNQPTFSSGLFSNITVHLGSPADFGDYLVNMSNIFGIYDLIFQVIQESPPQMVDIFCISRFMANQLEICFKPGFNGGRVQTFAIEYKSTTRPDSPWKNSSITDITNTRTLNGIYYVNISHPPPGDYEYRMYSWNEIGRSPYSAVITIFIPEDNCCTWKTPDTMENTNQTTLIVSGVLFSLAACLFVAALVLFIHSRKGVCSGVSNLQADTGETRCHYEDVNASSSPTTEYEELSHGSEKQPGSTKYLYTNTMHTSTM